MVVTKLVTEFSHDVHFRYVQVLNGRANGSCGRGGLTVGPQRVQLGSEGEVQDYIVFMATDNTVEVQLELCKVQVSWR